MGTNNIDSRRQSAAKSERKSTATLVPPFHCLHQHQHRNRHRDQYNSITSSSLYQIIPWHVTSERCNSIAVQFRVTFLTRSFCSSLLKWWRIIKVTTDDESTINYQRCVRCDIWTERPQQRHCRRSRRLHRSYIIYIFIKNEVEPTKSYN